MRKTKERRDGRGGAQHRWKASAAVVVAVAGTSLPTRLASAATTTAWTNMGGGSFNVSGNWSAGVPGLADTAQFNILNSYAVTLDINPSITAMSVGGSNVTFANTVSGRTFNISSTLNVNSGSLILNAPTPVNFSVANNAGFNTAVNVSNGNQMSVLNLSVGAAGNSTSTFDGTNSSLTVNGQTNIAFGAGKLGTLIFSNHAAGSLSDVNMSTVGPGVSNLSLSSGASVNVGSVNVAINTLAGATASLTVSGAGTVFNQAAGGTFSLGTTSVTQATMTVSNNASATLGAGLNVNSTGELDILSGGTVGVGGPVAINSGSGSRGTIQISGAGSGLTITGISPLTVGSASGNTANLIINGGTCTTSSSAMTVNKTGLVTISGGALNLNGDLTVDGGTVQRVIGSAGLNWVSGKTMTVQNGGTVSLTGNFNAPTSATINVIGAGSALTTGTFTLATSDQINITSGGTFGPSTLKILSNNSGVSVNVSGNGSGLFSGTTQFNSGVINYNGGTVSPGNLSLAGTGQLLMSPGHDKALVLSGLTIGGSGNLDLSDNFVMVSYSAGDTTHAMRETIRNLLINGRNAGPGMAAPWNGLGGISSSYATTNGNGFNLAIGYADNEDLAAVRASGSYTSFGGQAVASNTVLVTLTRGADATMDGVVDGQDVAIIGTHFQKPGSGQWCFGDFDYSGTCDGSDVAVLGTTFGKTSPILSPAQMTAEFGAAFTSTFEAGQAGVVPEPAGLTLIGLGMLALRRRRRYERPPGLKLL